MNKIFHIILFIILTIFIPHKSYSITLDNLDNILIKNNIFGEFTQTKIIEGFPNPIISSGNFIIKDKILFWNTVKPRENNIKINESGIYSKKNDNSWNKIKSEYDKSLFLDIVNMNFSKIDNLFNIKITGDNKNWEILLKPKSSIVGKIFKEIKIYGNKYVNNIHIIEENGDLTRMDFKNVYNK